jgi:GNAT superfamily N-acetyltransferase
VVSVAFHLRVVEPWLARTHGEAWQRYRGACRAGSGECARECEVREEPIGRWPSTGRLDRAHGRPRTEVSAWSGARGLVLRERPLEVSWTKDYDAAETPARWARRFDVSRWGLLGAYAEGRRVGGAVIAFDTPELELLQRRRDLAFLWDIRVAPELRGRGVGAALLAAVEVWARVRGCARLGVETQNVNVAACRFYARSGFALGAIHRFAYPGLPDEVQLLWYKDLP